MQEELRIAFFVLGFAFIVGILVHGWWTVRKNKKQSRPNSFQPRASEPRFVTDETDSEDDIHDDLGDIDDDMYDEVGVGKARVISSAKAPVFSPVHEQDVEDVDLSNNEHQNDTVPSEKLDADDIDLASSKAVSDEDARSSEAELETSEKDAVSSSPVHVVKVDETKSNTAPMYSGVVTQPKPEFAKSAKHTDLAADSSAIPEPPGFLLKKDKENIQATDTDASKESQQSESAVAKTVPPEPDFSLDVQEGPDKSAAEKEKAKDKAKEKDKPANVEKELGFAEQAKRFMRRNKKTVAEKIRKEPVVKASDKAKEDQMRIDFEQVSIDDDSLSSSPEPKHEQERAEKQTHDGPETDVLVLNVRAAQDKPINGAALLPMLLTLGFKFGEHDIFHRHVNTNGKGPILFSLTNMFKPGVFDIDNIENFSSYGVSLFMMLPIEGEAQQVFNMMHNAARKLSDEFGCKILDGNKVPLSKQSLQQYSERIREFERRRLSR